MKTITSSPKAWTICLPLTVAMVTFTWMAITIGCAKADDAEAKPTVDTETGYTDSYDISDCEFVDQGETPYLILMPGYQLVLEGPEGGKNMTLVRVVEVGSLIHFAGLLPPEPLVDRRVVRVLTLNRLEPARMPPRPSTVSLAVFIVGNQ